MSHKDHMDVLGPPPRSDLGRSQFRETVSVWSVHNELAFSAHLVSCL